MRRFVRPLLLGLSLGAAALLPLARAETLTYAGAQGQVISSTTVHERAADWSGNLNGLHLSGDSLVPDGERGMYTSPVIQVPAFDEVVPSWNVQTPGGYAVLKVRVQVAGGGWTDWYSFGRWERGGDRYSMKTARDPHAALLTDTLRLNAKATALQYHLTLVGAGSRAQLVALNTSDRALRGSGLGTPGDPQRWNRVIDVPQRSQMLYPDGGEVWCSPTSVSMILAYLGTHVTVPQAAKGTYDRVYDGTGNWAFNAAYAGELGLRAFVTRLPSLAAAEEFIARGQPLAVSLGWGRGELTGAPLPASTGHLMVLVGFDAQGNPVLNDPAAPSDAAVRRTYPRAQFERLWLEHSGGLSYVIEPRQGR